ncbi:MAG: hypothetical protein QXK39_05505, partial [Nitrososphaerota archaeon]
MTTVEQASRGVQGRGLKINRFYTRAGENVFQLFKWDKRTSQIRDSMGAVVFEMKDVEVPAFWSRTATDVVASKYLHGALDGGEAETS